MSVVHLNKGDEGYHAFIWLFIHPWRAYCSLPRPCPEMNVAVSVSEAGQWAPSAWSEHLDKNQGSRVASLVVTMELMKHQSLHENCVHTQSFIVSDFVTP